MEIATTLPAYLTRPICFLIIVFMLYLLYLSSLKAKEIKSAMKKNESEENLYKNKERRSEELHDLKIQLLQKELNTL